MRFSVMAQVSINRAPDPLARTSSTSFLWHLFAPIVLIVIVVEVHQY